MDGQGEQQEQGVLSHPLPALPDKPERKSGKIAIPPNLANLPLVPGGGPPPLPHTKPAMPPPAADHQPQQQHEPEHARERSLEVPKQAPAQRPRKAVDGPAIELPLHHRLVSVCKQLELEVQQRDALVAQLKGLSKVAAFLAHTAERRRQAQVPAALPTTAPSEVLFRAQLKRLQTRVAKCGWVEKEGRVVKSWRRRWMVLRGTSLVYYESPDKQIGNKSRGEVRLESECQTSVVQHADSVHTTLCVEGDSGRKLVFAPPTPSELEDWQRHLECKRALVRFLHATRNRGAVPSPLTLAFVNNTLAASGADEEGRVLQRDEMDDLTHFSFGALPLHDDDVLCIAPHLACYRKLGSLVVRDVGLTDGMAGVLADGLAACGSLVSLDLRQNKLTGEGAAVLAKHFGAARPYPQPDRRLEELLVDDNAVGDAGAEALAALLCSDGCPHLCLVGLGGARVGDAGATAVAGALLAALKTSRLSPARGAGAGAGAAGGGEVRACTIRLHQNAIGDAGATRLAEAVAAVAVCRLELATNCVGEDGAAALGRALAHQGAHLRVVDVTNNRFSKDGAAAKDLFRSIAVLPGLDSVALFKDTRLESSALTTLRVLHAAGALCSPN